MNAVALAELAKLEQLTEAAGRWPERRAELAGLRKRNEPSEHLVVLGREAQR